MNKTHQLPFGNKRGLTLDPAIFQPPPPPRRGPIAWLAQVLHPAE